MKGPVLMRSWRSSSKKLAFMRQKRGNAPVPPLVTFQVIFVGYDKIIRHL